MAFELPRTNNNPWFTSGALIVLLIIVREVTLVSVPGPFTVLEFKVSAVSALLKSVVRLTVALLKVKAPGPPSVPAC